MDPGFGSPFFPGAAAAPPPMLMRSLYAAAIAGSGGGARPREAWGAAGLGVVGGNAPVGAGIGEAAAGAFDGATNAFPGSAAQMAMALVDESFRQQVGVLKQALARHQAALDTVRSPKVGGGSA